eukprot:TRINITY_DN55761_c0_g1_i1.p3 TRINITY_DN55761_c0_g1~~TRINITY_DN55761_c0_g1_i1.p3  ORF type:complete len:125 (-),score=46.52 TRINITY_DN55761_c0_g1_i1:104-478(-)
MGDEKSNEILAAKELLKIIDIKDNIVTWDVLNTQKSTVEAVIKNKGDYVGALKGNQGNLYNDVKDYFDEEELEKIKNKKENHVMTKEKEHNAIVTPVSYTHLTLPTILLVQILVVAVSLKKKKT